MQVEKSVFISYRRSTSTYQARAVYQSLVAQGYDAFLDFETIDSGAFDQVILNQIKARAHFVLILSPGALERCVNEDDWLRREIETAMTYERNVVPLLFSGFSFRDNKKYLIGKLERLSFYNAVNVPADYFEEAMTRIHTRFLSKPIETILHPTPKADEKLVEARIEQAEAIPEVTEQELTASEAFSRAYDKGIAGLLDTAIEGYTEAIRLNPDYADAYYNRGVLKADNNEIEAGIADVTRAIELNPQNADYYTGRGALHKKQQRLTEAIADYTRALELHPTVSKARLYRGIAYREQGQYRQAFTDFSDVIQQNPLHYQAFFHRGYLYSLMGEADSAVQDYLVAVDLNPNFPIAHNNIGWHYYLEGDYEKAITHANEALATESKVHTRGAAYHTRGSAYLKLGRCQEAIADFEAALAAKDDEHHETYLQDLEAARQQCKDSV